MSLLKHSAMHPLTPGFAEAYAHEMKCRNKVEFPVRIREGITAAEFQEALSVIGVDSPKDLARLLGCNVASAQGKDGYYNNPERINRATESGSYLYSISHAYYVEENRYCIEDPSKGRIAVDPEQVAIIESTWNRLFGVTPYGHALREEYRRRALLEGFDALTEKQQDALLDHLRVMLQDIGEPRENNGPLDPCISEWSKRARDVAASLRRTRNGDTTILNFLLEGALEDLVRSDCIMDGQRVGRSDRIKRGDPLKEYAGVPVTGRDRR